MPYDPEAVVPVAVLDVAPLVLVAQAITDLIGGNVHVMQDNTTTSLPHVKGGRLKAIAVAQPN